MSKRISKVIALVGASGALALSGIGVAQASNGADDPPGHHHAHHCRHHHQRPHCHHHRGAHLRGQLVDDNGGGRQAEPGDDRGAGVEPGDDNGAGVEPGDDSGGHGGRG